MVINAPKNKEQKHGYYNKTMVFRNVQLIMNHQTYYYTPLTYIGIFITETGIR